MADIKLITAVAKATTRLFANLAHMPDFVARQLDLQMASDETFMMSALDTAATLEREAANIRAAVEAAMLRLAPDPLLGMRSELQQERIGILKAGRVSDDGAARINEIDILSGLLERYEAIVTEQKKASHQIMIGGNLALADLASLNALADEQRHLRARLFEMGVAEVQGEGPANGGAEGE